jgi:hypothetical protein
MPPSNVSWSKRAGSPPYVYAQLAENAIDTGQIQEALHWVRRLAAQDTGRAVQVTAGAMLARIGRNDEARALLATGEDPAASDRGDTLWRALEARLRWVACGGWFYLEAATSPNPRRMLLAADTIANRSVRDCLVLTGNYDDPLEQVFGTSGHRDQLSDIERNTTWPMHSRAHREQTIPRGCGRHAGSVNGATQA